ncbi:MAG TPA: hypothetical protein VM100_08475 [Longimicrobiales bacterium]|nr:hypothetical protein [Longimicrobiales bacterium]
MLALLFAVALQTTPHHYVYFNLDRARIRDASFLATTAIEGAQIKYTWRQLEPEAGVYDFSAIREDLQFLTDHKKKLFIQLQDVSFDSARINVPTYLLTDPQYHGGIAPQRENESSRNAGWAARRWDVAVQRRMHLLYQALGKEFDGKIEGITLPETSLVFGDDTVPRPEGFNNARYRDAVIENMTAFKRAFPKSVAMQYLNFMPGKWDNGEGTGYLREVFEAAERIGIAVGGPDLMPYKAGQMRNSYPLLRASKGTRKGLAVQDGNLEHINPRTKARVTLNEILEFATDYLGLYYIFWQNEEPSYTNKVLPLLQTMTGK